MILMIVGHVGAWLLAIALAQRLKIGGGAAALATAAFVLHALLVTLIVLVSGSAGMLGPWPLAAGGVASGIAGALIGRFDPRPLRQTAREMWAESPAAVASCLALLALVTVRHLYNAWYHCPPTQDEMEYHLPKLALWIQHGTLARPESIDLRTYFPAGMQLLQAWWVGFARNDFLIEGASLEMALLALFACAALVRRLGGTRSSALLAGTLFVAMPAALLNGTTALNDFPVAAMILAGFALTSSRSALVVAASSVMLGAGIKPLALFALPGLLLAWIPAWREAKPLDLPRLAPWALIALAAFGGSYWYLRNAAQFGNPFYPVTPAVAGRSETLTEGLGQTSTGPNVRNLGGNLGAIFGPRMVNLGSVTNPSLPRQTGWGWLLTLAGLPAIAWMAWRDPKWRRTAAAFAVSLLFVLLLVQVDDYTARFVLFLPGLMACVVASLPRTAVVASVACAASLANVWETRVPLTFSNPGAAAHMRSVDPLERDCWTIRFAAAPPALRAFYTSTEPVMAMTFNYDVYALARGDYRRRVEHIVPRDADELLAAMDRLQCRWLVVTSRKLLPITDAAVVAGRLRIIAPGHYERR